MKLIASAVNGAIAGLVMIVLLASTPAYAGQFFVRNTDPCAPFGNLELRLFNLKRTVAVNCQINNLACMVTTGSWPSTYGQASIDKYTADYNANILEISEIEAMTVETRKTACFQGRVFNP